MHVNVRGEVFETALIEKILNGVARPPGNGNIKYLLLYNNICIYTIIYIILYDTKDLINTKFMSPFQMFMV